MHGALHAPGTVEGRQLRRPYSPVAARLAWHHVEMEVRRFLPAVHAVVLERQDPERPVGADLRRRDPLRGGHDGRALGIGKIQQRRDMAARDHAALPHFELPGIDHRQRVLALVNDLPSFLGGGHAQVARVSGGEFEHFFLH